MQEERQPDVPVRTSYLTNSSQREFRPDEPAVTMTRGELALLVETACSAALATGLPLLIDKQRLSEQIDVSPAQIDRLRKRGMPCVPVGTSVRFVAQDVVAWLRAQGPSNDSE